MKKKFTSIATCWINLIKIWSSTKWLASLKKWQSWTSNSTFWISLVNRIFHLSKTMIRVALLKGYFWLSHSNPRNQHLTCSIRIMMILMMTLCQAEAFLWTNFLKILRIPNVIKRSLSLIFLIFFQCSNHSIKRTKLSLNLLIFFQMDSLSLSLKSSSRVNSSNLRHFKWSHQDRCKWCSSHQFNPFMVCLNHITRCNKIISSSRINSTRCSRSNRPQICSTNLINCKLLFKCKQTSTTQTFQEWTLSPLKTSITKEK